MSDPGKIVVETALKRRFNNIVIHSCADALPTYTSFKDHKQPDFLQDANLMGHYYDVKTDQGYKAVGLDPKKQQVHSMRNKGQWDIVMESARTEAQKIQGGRNPYAYFKRGCHAGDMGHRKWTRHFYPLRSER